MIFRIRSVRATLNFYFTAKQHFNSITACKHLLNVRFLCNVQVENASPKSTGFVDAGSNSSRRLSESRYFYSVMENNPKYPDLILSERILKENENSKNRLVIFLRNVDKKISQEKETGDIEFPSDLEDDVYTMHDMIEIFHFLPMYCKLFSKEIKSEVKKLHNLMEDKIKNMKKSFGDIGLMLTLLNLMIKADVPLNLSYYFVIYIYKKLMKLTVIQAVEYFYILHHYKMVVEKETKFSFEVHMSKLLPQMNKDEIAVFSYALFRSQVRPGTLITESVSSRILEEVEHLNDIQACTLFKFLLFSGRRKISDNLIKIFDKCIPIIDNFKGMTAIHIICSGINISVECKKLFERVWDKANEEFDCLRLKDLERLLLSSLYNNFRVTEDSKIVKLILQKFTKENNEVRKYPRSFFSLVTFLIMHNIYPEDMIRFALSDEFNKLLREIHSRSFYRELFFIEASAELERPQYNLSFLTARQKMVAVMKNKSDLFEKSSSYRCNFQMLDGLKEIYDNESVALTTPLPHYSTMHPILCINRSNEPQKIGDKLKHKDCSIVKAPKDGNLWIAFILLRWQACLYDRVTPNFVSEAKLRQFRAAGYIPVQAYNFLLHEKTEEELKEFLRKSIEEAIQSANNQNLQKENAQF